MSVDSRSRFVDSNLLFRRHYNLSRIACWNPLFVQARLTTMSMLLATWECCRGVTLSITILRIRMHGSSKRMPLEVLSILSVCPCPLRWKETLIQAMLGLRPVSVTATGTQIRVVYLVLLERKTFFQRGDFFSPLCSFWEA